MRGVPDQHGNQMLAPQDSDLLPGRDFLDWNRKNVFRCLATPMGGLWRPLTFTRVRSMPDENLRTLFGRHQGLASKCQPLICQHGS